MNITQSAFDLRNTQLQTRGSEHGSRDVAPYAKERV